jgi:hypothetical protein
MPDIPVSINAKGDITCGDYTTTQVNQVITWNVSGGTITNITPGTPSPFKTAPASTNGQWSATIVASGSYTITDQQGKQKTPRIIVNPPEEKAKPKVEAAFEEQKS